jgi:pyruvate dehydrogenase E2 component (dihydrolipoamide acetyltransferase)
MAIVVEMPRLSDTMKVGSIVHWLKKEGDAIEIGQLLAEIETDKAVMEYESEEDGVLAKLLVSEKEGVPIGSPIAIIAEEDGEDLTEALAQVEALRASLAAGDAEEDAPEEPAAEAAAAPEPAPTPAPRANPAPAVEVEPVVGSSGRLRVSPVARRIAAEKGLDLSRIQGTGPGGRIIKRDVESAEPGGGVFTRGAVGPRTGPAHVDEGTSQMRQVIAERLLESKNGAPHFYLQLSVDMSRAMELRADLNEEQSGVKVSVNDLVLKAVACASTRVPAVNASWMEEGGAPQIRRHNGVHVGVAVAIEDGLVTPVIRDADRKDILAIATEIRDLAGKARDRKLTAEAYQGNTITVSNLGMFGIESFTAIINPPASVILAVGAVATVPVVDAHGNIVPGTRMNVTLSCDHRVVDGALGAQWLAVFKKVLERPYHLMMAG